MSRDGAQLDTVPLYLGNGALLGINPAGLSQANITSG